MAKSNVVSLKSADPIEMGEALHQHLVDVTQRISLCSHVLNETNALDACELEVRAVIQLDKATQELNTIWNELDNLLIQLRRKPEVANG